MTVLYQENYQGKINPELFLDHQVIDRGGDEFLAVIMFTEGHRRELFLDCKAVYNPARDTIIDIIEKPADKSILDTLAKLRNINSVELKEELKKMVEQMVLSKAFEINGMNNADSKNKYVRFHLDGNVKRKLLIYQVQRDQAEYNNWKRKKAINENWFSVKAIYRHSSF